MIVIALLIIAHALQSSWVCLFLDGRSCTDVPGSAWVCPVGEASSSSDLSSPGKYARKTGAEVGSELSLALLTTIREAVASRTSSMPMLNVCTCPHPALLLRYLGTIVAVGCLGILMICDPDAWHSTCRGISLSVMGA